MPSLPFPLLPLDLGITSITFNIVINIRYVSGPVFFTTYFTMYGCFAVIGLWTFFHAYLPTRPQAPRGQTSHPWVHCQVCRFSYCAFPRLSFRKWTWVNNAKRLCKLYVDVNKRTASNYRMCGKQIPRRPVIPGCWLQEGWVTDMPPGSPCPHQRPGKPEESGRMGDCMVS